MLFFQQFAKKLTSQVKVLELCVIFWSCETDNAETADLDNSSDNSLVNVSEQLCLKYRNFFNINKTEQQLFHWSTDHTIKLKSDFKLLYMQTYNMSSAELKAFDKYLIKTLIKK